MECLFSDQSKALIHVFFGEREVAKIPDIPKDTPLIPVKRRGGRRRHHGRRHRHGFRQRRNSGAAEGSRSGRARPRSGDHPEKLREFREAWPLHSGIRRRLLEAHRAHADLRRIRGSRHGHRSGLRRHGPEEGNLRRARPHLQTRSDPRLEHFHAEHRRNRRRHFAPRIRDRHALFQPGQRDAPARNRARQERPARK